MKTILNRIVFSVFWVLFHYLGLEALTDAIESRVTVYRLRLNIVPISYKVFLVSLGMVLVVSWQVAIDNYREHVAAGPSIDITQPVLVVHAKTEEPQVEEVWAAAEFSAYTASVDETDASPLVMASGKVVYIGAIACPDKYIIEDGKRVFGKKVEVKGLGVYTCEDRMSERYRGKNNFDIFMPTKKEALAFGRQSLEYRIIK